MNINKELIKDCNVKRSFKYIVEKYIDYNIIFDITVMCDDIIIENKQYSVTIFIHEKKSGKVCFVHHFETSVYLDEQILDLNTKKIKRAYKIQQLLEI